VSAGVTAASPRTSELFGVRLVASDVAAATGLVLGRARSGEGGYCCFANVHVLTMSRRSGPVRAALGDAWTVFPDGFPVAWMMRRLGSATSRVAGPDVMASVIAAGRRDGLRHFLLGSTPDVLAKLQLVLATRFGEGLVCGAVSPPFGEVDHTEEEALVAAVRRADADLVWCGLGAPRQELWMRRWAPALAPAVVLGVGAAFDFLAGTKRRAPRWMQDAGLEWAHRMLSEPRRLGPRYLRTNTQFVARATVELAAHRRGR